VNGITHWHTITDCEVMGSYPSRELAEHAVYTHMRGTVGALLERWTQDLLDTGVVVLDVARDEIEGWIVEPCRQEVDHCNTLENSGVADVDRRFGSSGGEVGEHP
jgi:hypothetical protein